MSRLLPATLRGRLILLILAALTIAQTLSLWLFVDERSAAVRTALALETADRAANVTLLLEDTPDQQHPGILRAANSPLVRFTVKATPLAQATTQTDGAMLYERIVTLLGATGDHDIRLNLRRAEVPIPPMPGVSSDMMRMHRSMNMGHMSATEMQISIRLKNGDWLNVATRFRTPVYQWAMPAAATFAVTAMLLVLVLWLALGRLTEPLRTLATYAERFGRGETVETLRPAGPVELQELSHAFNEMHERISRFVAERTRLLGAIGHDLRSPLTALRVRAEMVEDEETRTRMIAIIQEMHEMVEATLTFASGMAAIEPIKTVDLTGFIEALTSEMVGAGQDVTLVVPETPIEAQLRPIATRRALRNLIENAVRYGQRAQVSMDHRGDSISIIVDDDGPGIPKADLVRVFDPFVRLEASRSRETGGTGLGLSIARSILRAEGGDVVLENHPDQGLRARLELPNIRA